MSARQLILDVHKKLIVDLFAGGGGMSRAFEVAFGRSPDIAINHNDDALSMHRANHPQTRHFIADVFEVDPRDATQGRPVGWLHLSPDCTHHSQAAGGQPRSKRIRGLSWVGVRWAGQVAPDVVSLENVAQILNWGPLVAKRDKATGRVVTLDMVVCPHSGKTVNRVADRGEHVPVQNQFLVPDKKRAGQTWQKLVKTLESLGYKVECRTLCAADFGGHTTRDRLFMIARRDGLPICWPERTHFKKPLKGQKKWKAAAECIDFSLPCPSIFTRSKPLAEATNRRIAKGIKRYVLDSAKPFIVPIAHYNGSTTAHSTDEPLRTITSATKGGEFALATPIIAKFRGESVGHSMEDPLPTITAGGDCARPAGAPHALGIISPILVQAAHGDGKPGGVQRWGSGAKDIADPLGVITASGGHAVAAATLVQTGYGERDGQSPRSLDIDAPLGTIVGTGKHALATAYLMQANGGFNTTPGHAVDEPISAITNTGSQQQLVTAHLAHLHANCDARGLEEPIRTIGAEGQHHGLVSAVLSSYYSDDSDRCRDPREPVATITTENRIGLVSAFMSRQFGASVGHDAQEPLGTTTAGGGGKSALVECVLSKEDEAGALRVAAFLMRYYGEGGQWGDINNPLATITTKDRLALVTVLIKGTPYVIVDIGLRMLQPRELFNGQDFPPDYEIERGHDGRVFSKSAQVRMCGNSVDPIPAAAMLAVNAPDLAVRRVA